LRIGRLFPVAGGEKVVEGSSGVAAKMRRQRRRELSRAGGGVHKGRETRAAAILSLESRGFEKWIFND